jgi:hypothetical protein
LAGTIINNFKINSVTSLRAGTAQVDISLRQAKGNKMVKMFEKIKTIINVAKMVYGLLGILLLMFLHGCQTSPSYVTSFMYNPIAPYLENPGNIESRAITQENPTGEKGVGCKDKGNGNCRKGAPAFVCVKLGEIKVLADIKGPGVVRHIWITIDDCKSPYILRNHILRIYWDGSQYPSVEVPLGDFFGVAHGRVAAFTSPWLIQPEERGSLNSFFPMPFSKQCRITVENDTDKVTGWLFYQVDYTIGDPIKNDSWRFHAQFRRENPVPVGKDYQLLKVEGSNGVFVGSVLGINPIGPGWWGEGEMKFYIDGDGKYPTICGTGTEDYVLSAWGINKFDALYSGVNSYEKDPNTGFDRFVSFYRFHYLDPIYFKNDLRVEIQLIGANGLTGEDKEKYGWAGPHIHPGMSDWLYDRSGDYCSTVFWYQKLMNKPMLPPLPNKEERSRNLE